MQVVHAATMRWSLRLVDTAVIACTFVLTALLREWIRSFWKIDIIPGPAVLQAVTLQNQLHLIVLIVPVWLLSLHVGGAYADLRRTRSDLLFIRLLRAVGMAVLLLLALLFIVQPALPPSRTFLVSFAAMSSVTLFLARRWLLRRPATRDEVSNILVVGSMIEAEPFLEALRRHPGWGVRVAGVIRPDDEEVTSIGGVKVLGTLSQLPSVLEREAIAQVFMTGRAWSTGTLRRVADACEELGVTFSMDANFLGLSVSQADVQDFDGWSVLSFSSTPTNGDALVIKRVMDLVGAAAALVLLTPVFLLTAVAIKLEDGGPVLFAQERSGLFGRKFSMYKFRSMVIDAEARKFELEKLNEMSGPVFKMTRDPRITRVGAFIRKTSIDELPQFWNVFRGEMSLVGPRPPIPAEVAQYVRWQMRRLSMKPGLTCIWQVSGRNHVDFETWMKLDLQYIDNWSLFLDVKLLVRTVPAVLLGSGAR
ncbi:MAG: sugar transferase [Pseudomonadota bacterium]|nr:sugar transferase [Pseudomonadota bacterium]